MRQGYSWARARLPRQRRCRHPRFTSTPVEPGHPRTEPAPHLRCGLLHSDRGLLDHRRSGAAPARHVRELEHGLGNSAEAQTRTYVDGKSGRTVYVHHASLSRLKPGTDYIYLAAHEGATPDSGSFRTPPAAGRP
ncbi:fibronectin type III domain-containing protein [Streptomyces sp. NPDC047009]|uniref:fibronectin type III domain-containing protein n=1 Tax=unclassified Streptomyces TaxID=2593676 RepID=UPI0033D57D99